MERDKAEDRDDEIYEGETMRGKDRAGEKGKGIGERKRKKE